MKCLVAQIDERAIAFFCYFLLSTACLVPTTVDGALLVSKRGAQPQTNCLRPLCPPVGDLKFTLSQCVLIKKYIHIPLIYLHILCT